MSKDTFYIQPYLKFLLVFRPIGSLVFIAIGFSIINSPSMDLNEIGYIAIFFLAGYALYEISKLFKWYSFYVSLDDEQISIGGKSIPWDEIQSASATDAIQFSTFISIKDSEGVKHEIPAAIQESSFIFNKVKKHFPSLQIIQ